MTHTVATYAQPVLSPRAVGLGFYGASVKDSRDFVANPSGLVGMKDWDFNATTYLPASSGTGGGFVFGGFGGGKRFLEDHALAAQYTPGALLEFVLPSTVTLKGVGISADRKISYSEPAAAARRNTSGAGFPWETSSPEQTAARESS